MTTLDGQHGRQPAETPPRLTERVMVCMSSNALARRVIRAGADVAYRLSAKWYAVYVETPRERPSRLPAGQAAALRDNIDLAQELGGTVVRVKAADPAEGLIAFARREGVTRAIFGQSARSRWELLWRRSPLRTFSSAVPHAPVEVVPFDDSPPSEEREMMRTP